MKLVGDNEVWMSTGMAGLVKYYLTSGRFYLFDQVNKYSRTSRHFNIDRKYLWVATDEGLVQLDKNTQKFRKFWTKSLSQNLILATSIGNL